MATYQGVLWRRIGIGILSLWILTGVLWFSLWDFYVGTKPRANDVSNGRVIPLSSHGIVVYLTPEESAKLKLLNYGVYAFTFAFAAVYIWKKPFGNQE